eukprot:TRINITY_DN2344_c0_g1_i6.p1 TRINITY_DN2344_c0_g1~~TRINITY_DN2344_c0_g1_i6.p1  ORF type:complete len:1167 (-),score=360.77 TRINITY_DN2344_c0_g1_i6:2196-5696(-)
MNLEPAAHLARELVKGGLKIQGPQDGSSQGAGLDLGHDRAWLQARRAEDLKGPGGAAALGQAGALQEHLAGVDPRAVQKGQIGRGQHPGQAGGGAVPALPALTGQDLQLHSQAALGNHQPGQLAQGQAVFQGYGVGPHKAHQLQGQNRPLGPPADGVGTVQDHYSHSGPGAPLQTCHQGAKKSVDPATHIHQVNQQPVQPGQHLGGRPPGLAVQGVDGHPQARVPGVLRFHHVVLPLGEEAVLRAEKGFDTTGIGLGNRLDRRGEFQGDCRGVAQQAQGGALEAGGRPLGQAHQPGGHWLRHKLDLIAKSTDSQGSIKTRAPGLKPRGPLGGGEERFPYCLPAGEGVLQPPALFTDCSFRVATRLHLPSSIQMLMPPPIAVNVQTKKGGSVQESLPIYRHLGHHHHHDHSHEHPRGGGPGEYAPALVELTRNGLTESVHRGAIVVAGPDGKRLKGLGHPSMPTFLRSAAKPLQALPLITTGAVDKYGLEPVEIAAACGSLNGEDFQREAVRSMLAKAGLEPGLLDCGLHRPFHRDTAQALIKAGEKPTTLHSACAGKHAAMLIMCAASGWPLEGYLDISHPVQKLVLSAVARFTAYPAEQIGIGEDDCGVPTFRLPLVALAGAFARLAAPGPAGLEPQWAEAAEAIMAACLAHPEMIAGTGRICTRIMQAAPGVVLAKTGSEGTYALALPQQGLGVGFQIEDGALRALGPVVTEALHHLGILDHETLEGPLADLHRPVFKTHRGDPVGTMSTVFSLQAWRAPSCAIMERLKGGESMPRAIAAFAALLLAALLAAACGQPPVELNPDQAKFKKQVRKILAQESEILTPLLAKGAPSAQLQKNIDQQFAKAIAEGKPLDHDLAVLSAKAIVLAWRSPDPQDLTQTYLGYIGQNYSHFKKMQPVFKDDRVAAFEVYTQYGPGFGICAPLSSGSKLLGALCVGYDYDSLIRRHGLDKNELLAINFNNQPGSIADNSKGRPAWGALLNSRDTSLELFDFHRAGLVLRGLGDRVIDRVGQPVGAGLPEVEGHPHHARLHLRGHPGGELHRAPPRAQLHPLAIGNAQLGRVGQGDVGRLLAHQVVQAPAAPGLGAGVVVVQPPAGGKHQRVLLVRHLGRRGPFRGLEVAQAAGEAAVLVQEGRAQMVQVGHRPLQAVALDALVLDALHRGGQH